jgi:hypothetical protein
MHYIIKYCLISPTYVSVNPDPLKMVQFSLEQAMKAQRGSRGIALLFL